MGTACTKSKSKKNKENGVEMRGRRRVQEDTDSMYDTRDLQEDKELDNLRNWLEEDLNMFVMTNVLLSVQFFQNFEKEMEALRDLNRHNEGCDLKDHRIKHFKGDNVMERIGKYLVHRPQHGQQKHSEDLLHPLRSYFVYQNVLVESEKGESNDLSLDKKPPYYQLRVDTLNDDPETIRLRNAGYVNLKEVQTKEEEVIYESIDNIQTSGSSRRNSMGGMSSSGVSGPQETTMRRNSKGMLTPIRRMSHLQVPGHAEDPVYTYTTIQKLTAPKPIHDRYFNTNAAACAIPTTTFTKVERQILENARRTGKQGSLINVIGYLSSTKFYSHFEKVLINKLAEDLEVGNCFDNATEQCQRVVVRQHIVTHHLMPAFKITFWPEVEVKPKSDDDDDGKKSQVKTRKHIWPSAYMEKRYKKMGMYLLPIGYLKRRGHNTNEFELQWQYACPRGEDYLLTHIMHSQMRCYLFTLLLLKQFIPEENKIIGLNHTQIMHLLFSVVKKTYTHWQDDRPADTLIYFLNTLQKAINRREIKDFFIPSRNLLQSSPIVILNKAEAVINRILENPLPYVLLAVKNLRMRSTFYPTLDVTEIYKILTVKRFDAYLNPEKYIKKRRKTSDSDSDSDEDIEVNNKAKEVDTKKRWKKQYHRQLVEEKAAKEKDIKRVSSDTIQLIPTIKDPDLVEERQQHILRIFINHFILMSQTSRNFGAFDQSLMYMEQAKRLTKLLSEILPHGSSEVKDYEEKIAKEEINGGEDNFKKSQKSSENADLDNGSAKKRLSYHNRALPQTPDAENANIQKPFTMENQTGKI